MAKAYHGDFLKSRRKNRLNPRVRTGVVKKLDAYVARVDQLRRTLRSMPDGAVAYIRDNGQDHSVDMIWTITEQIIACLDRMHESLERQRVRMAAPMTPEEEHEFWVTMSRLAEAMESLRDLAEAILERISAKDPEHDDPALNALASACKKLCEAVGCFGRNSARRSRTGRKPDIPSIQTAAEDYHRELTQVSQRVERAIPDINEVHRSLRASRDSIAADTNELLATIGLQQLHIDVACQVSALRFDLPQEAAQNTTEIRAIIDPVLRENMALAAKLEVRVANEGESSDLVPEGSLPDYTQLANKPTEHTQRRVIVDCLLSKHAKNGPRATMTRRDLATAALRLADFRGVAGMGETNVWNRLSTLVDLKIVRRFDPEKSRANQNASGGYRLTIPAQKRYSQHVGDVVAEIDRMPTLDSESFED